jgi:ribosomal protein L32
MSILANLKKKHSRAKRIGIRTGNYSITVQNLAKCSLTSKTLRGLGADWLNPT